jgi:hypothetical protein
VTAKIYYLELLHALESTLSYIPAAFTVVSTQQSALGPRDGIWPVLKRNQESLWPSNGDINRLVMMMN